MHTSVFVIILQSYALLVPFKGFLVFDLRNILVTSKIFLKSRFVCTISYFFYYLQYPKMTVYIVELDLFLRI